MAFVPNIYGPTVPLGEIVVTTSGTGVPLDTNLSRKHRPNTPTSDTNKSQYAMSFEDIIINSPSTNTGGIFIVTNNAQTDVASKNDTDSIILFIPKGSPPISLIRFLGGNRLQPGNLAVDAEQDNDKIWAVGIATS